MHHQLTTTNEMSDFPLSNEWWCKELEDHALYFIAAEAAAAAAVIYAGGNSCQFKTQDAKMFVQNVVD